MFAGTGRGGDGAVSTNNQGGGAGGGAGGYCFDVIDTTPAASLAYSVGGGGAGGTGDAGGTDGEAGADGKIYVEY